MQEPSPKHEQQVLLRFPDRPLVIVGGGTVDGALLRRLVELGAAVIAADGGADVALAAGVLPEAVVGDLDSLSDVDEWSMKARVIRVEEQETTDFEKALYVSDAPVTFVLGMTGRRLDHTLAALDVLAKYGAERPIILIDDTDLAVTLSGPFSFTIAEGERVSVHPLAPVRFAASSGLKWPLHGLLLGPGIRGGTSNVAVDGHFTITPEGGETGTWLLVMDKRWYFVLARRIVEGE